MIWCLGTNKLMHLNSIKQTHDLFTTASQYQWATATSKLHHAHHCQRLVGCHGRKKLKKKAWWVGLMPANGWCIHFLQRRVSLNPPPTCHSFCATRLNRPYKVQFRYLQQENTIELMTTILVYIKIRASWRLGQVGTSIISRWNWNSPLILFTKRP